MAPTQIRLKPESSSIVQLLLVVAALVWSVEFVAAQAPPADPDAGNGTLLPSSMIAGTPFAWVDYNPANVAGSNGAISITMPNLDSGARIHSAVRYAYGNFSALIKCPAGDITGLVPNFYTSSRETAGVNTVQDEIDFEFLGKNKTIVQVNYYVDGNNTGFEQIVDLGYDCSDDFHEYRIDWTPIRIKWFIDGQLKRTAYNLSGQPYPTKPGFLYVSMWDASKVNGGAWSGAPSSNADAPFVFQLSKVSAVELADPSFNDNATTAAIAPAPAVTPKPTPKATARLPPPAASRTPTTSPPPGETSPPTTSKWNYQGASRALRKAGLVLPILIFSGALLLLIAGFVYAVIQRKRAFAAPATDTWATPLRGAGDSGDVEDAVQSAPPPPSWLRRFPLSLKRKEKPGPFTQL